MKQSIYDIIIGPRMTEKGTLIGEKNRQFIFKVQVTANKRQVKEAVSKLFNVEVSKVSMLNQKGKVRKFKQKEGRTNDWKKAYVTLKEGFDIEFTGSP